jgi:Tfp pilus assembly protein PilF
MSPKTPRTEQIEAMLAETPGDAELRYFLAMEYLSAGDEAGAAERLRALTADSTYVPAFLMAAQVLARRGQEADACAILRKGVAEAQRQGNAHAAGEMQGLLDSLE